MAGIGGRPLTAAPGLPFTYSGPPPPAPTIPPASTNRRSLVRTTPSRRPHMTKTRTHDTNTDKDHPTQRPSASRSTTGQHTAHQRSSLRLATQLGLSLLGFFTRRSTGPRRTRTTPSYVLTQCNFLCACASSGATKQGPPSFVPAQVFQCLPHSKFGNWRRLGDGLSSAGIDEEEPKTKIF